MSNHERNLDKLAARHAQHIIRRTKAVDRQDSLSTQQSPGDVDNAVTKALGVLQENGVYACALYLLSRTQDEERRIAAVIGDEMLNLLANLGFPGWEKPTMADPRTNSEAILKHIAEKVTGDNKLERLLLAKETLEQMFIYARYGAKAWGAEEGRP